ncbi:hypothetical protein OG598_30745 [Micromonospora sp. NBC_00330]|uniref:hypothetical protein n=1 Tax=Micromonospora sp. NBC_00330 TaxID=2903585 RepID=UPI002E28C674|nr:hypothetical protein [Micromonospora sp. NBC_00330]
MAFRTWGRLLLTALGVSVLAGAGQLGVAYGFGIVRLTGAFTGTTVNQWPAQLVWVGWFAANAAVAGAVLTGRLAHRDAPAASTGRQLAVGGAAALGATVIAPLCMQPARAAELISVDPVWAVGICAMVGAVIGAGAAIAVLFRPELGWNMAVVAGVVWLLALISVLPSLGTAGPLPTVRLGVLEPSWLDDAAAQRLALLLLPIVALLAGAATAGLARSRGQAPLVSGATGVAGPVLVAFAYLTAGPGDAVDRYQTAPYYGSLIAILAGALGAAAAALLRWPTGTRTADPQAIEPTAILRPLPAGPALPGAANDRDSAANDRDGAERTDTETTNAELATGTKPAGVVAGPWATGDPDAVRTVPAHWDWPETTASGQHGPAPTTATPAAPNPAAPTQPAAWLTAPTGEFTAAGQTPPRQDDVLTTTEPSTGTNVSNASDATATGTTAGRADAATPTGGRAVDEPTGSTATDTSGSMATSGRPTGGRTTRKSAATPSGTGAPGSGTTSAAATSADATSAPTTSDATGSTARSSAAATSAAATSATPTSAAPTSTGNGTEAASAAPTGSDAPSPAATASTGTGSGTGTEASSAGNADHGTPEAPLTIKPRRGRKSKANPDATASDVADDTSPTGSATISETTASATTTRATTTRETATEATTTSGTTTGRATKGTRPGRSAASTASDAATDTPAPSPGSLSELSSSTAEVASAAASDTAATRITATGAKRAPATPATGSKRAPAASTTAGNGTSQVPANPEPATTATDATPIPSTGTGTGTTPAATTVGGSAPAPATETGATRAAAAPSTAAGQGGAEAIPLAPKAGTGSKAARADTTSPTSDSAIAGARDTDSARPAAGDVPAAGLFGATAANDPDADRWTPAPSAWPVTSTWTVPPQASEPEATASEGSSRPDAPTGPTPRPRHRAPLPDLSRAGTWNAFDTSRRRGSAEPQDGSTARTAPTEAGETTAPVAHPAAGEFPGTLGAPSGAAATSATTDSGTGTGTGDVAPTDTTSAKPTHPKVAEQPSRRGRLGGLFRRNRSRADEESPKTSDEAEPLASQDEEFVDWVAGLSKPVSDNEPEQENGRRSLRSTGRHHRD